MNGKHVIASIAFVSLILSAGPAAANEAPSPPMFLAEVLLLPVMMLLTFLGGGYLVLRAKGYKRLRLLWIPAVLAVMVSVGFELISLFVAFAFGMIALARAGTMVVWVMQAAIGERPAYLASVRPLRMFAASAALLLATVLLWGLFVASWGWSGWSTDLQSDLAEEHVRDFVAYQLAYAEEHKGEAGKPRFAKLGVGQDFNGHPRSTPTEVEYAEDGRGFTIHVLVSKSVPFWPYNYIFRQRAYRADESGQIRMIRVSSSKQRCPPDGPVVWKVTQEEIAHARSSMESRANEPPYPFNLIDSTVEPAPQP
jgi:hypothetical protein